MENLIEAAAKLIKNSNHTIAFTGAGSAGHKFLSRKS